MSDLSDIDFKTLYRQFNSVYLNLYETIHKDEVTLDLNTPEIRRAKLYSKQTISEFLIENGDEYLPVTEGYKSLQNIRRCHYFDRAIEPSLSKAEPTVMGYGYSTKRPLVKAPDLNLINLPDAYQTCIATCAGLAHIIKPVPQGSCVELGHQTMMAFEDNSYGLHDFSELGTLRQFELREELISESPNGFIISLEEDITDKLVLLSINGSLFFSSPTSTVFSQNSPHTIFLNSTKIPWRSLILATQRHLDLNHLDLLRVPNGEAALAVDQLVDPEMQKKMLLGPRSFAIVLTPTDISSPIALGQDMLFDSGLRTGIYMGGELAPAGILLNERNQPVNYVNQRQDDIYIVKANQYRSISYAHETAPWQLERNIDDSRMMDRLTDACSRMRNVSFYQVK